MSRLKSVTATTLVLEALRERDDFLTLPQLLEVLADRATKHQVEIALYWLRKVLAVDVIIDPAGVGHWYALPKELDRRHRVVAEMVKTERRASRKRKPKAGGAT